ncbi:RING-H2 finger protein ATL57-like protein [Cinnamomum micranthum f. kanehirae]|uniref:RING-type E3 ubiquitin transferase n=1 Tax=Cinnamomum micranthum f. kanehirae TaxID=337451 RepID=A0A443PVL1_9MAGN|nr:RING-H2 finger protein ATL57-like protein [Cinnamomum micranthum f. kanehirae]
MKCPLKPNSKSLLHLNSRNNPLPRTLSRFPSPKSMKPNIRRLLIEDDATTFTTSNQLPSQPHDDIYPTRPFNPSPGFDSSMAVILLVLLSALFFMGFFSVCIRRFDHENEAAVAGAQLSRRSRRQTIGGTRSSLRTPHCADPTIVRALPVFAYEGSVKGPLDCAICLSEFEEKDRVKIIPRCGHVYHPECIDHWLSSHDSCPLCRSTQLLALQGEVLLRVFDEMPDRAREFCEGDRAPGGVSQEASAREVPRV